jgi:serralysin
VGTDAALFSGASENFTFTKQTDGSWIVAQVTTDTGGTDVLRNVELLVFTDKTIALP